MTLQNAIAWTLIHFLWQGALAAALLAVVNLSWARATSRGRYAVAAGSMAAMVAVKTSSGEAEPSMVSTSPRSA